MSIPNLSGRRRGNDPALLAARVLDLERAIAQIPSRFLSLSATAPRLVVSQAAHGFTVGQWIARTPTQIRGVSYAESANPWSLASITPNPRDTPSAAPADNVAPLSLVLSVIDVDHVAVAQQGLHRIAASTYDDYTTYVLAENGEIAAANGADLDGRVRVALYSLSDGWVFLPGPFAGSNLGPVGLPSLYDVNVPIEPDVGVPLTWQTDGMREWRQTRLDGAGMIQLPNLSVWGNPLNTGTSEDMVAISGSTVGHVLQISNAGGPTTIAWAAIGTAALSDGSVTMAKLADLAGLSVIGRSANTPGVPAAITAATDGHVLRLSGTSLGFGTVAAAGLASDCVTTAKILDANVTNAKLDDIIAAGGPTGTSSVVPVITYNAKGRLTAVTTATITAAAIGAAATVHTHTLGASLTDVTITAAANRDFLRHNGTAWVDYDLGPITFGSASLALDGGWSGTATNVGLGMATSRFIFGGIGSYLDFVLVGTGVVATDVCARIRASSSSAISFYDQAFGTTHGTEVMKWTCSATAGSRRFDFAMPVHITGGSGLVIDNAGYLSFSDGVGGSGSLILAGTSSAMYVGAGLLMSSTYNAGTGNMVLELCNSGTGAHAVHVNGDLSLLATGGHATPLLTNEGDIIACGAAKKLGFFGSVGTAKVAVADLGALATTETSGGSYTGNEQSMLTHLKSDVTSLRTKLNALLDALQGYNAV